VREAAEGPSVWEVMAADPAICVDPEVLELVIADQRSASRDLLYPWVRMVARAAVTVIVAARRACPVPLSAHAAMDRMCLWFCRRLVSPAAVTLLIRHFVVETNLLAFIARNAGLPEPALRPVTLSGLGNRAVIEHDLNVYRLLAALGQARPPGGPDCAIGPDCAAGLDFSMLEVPAIDPEPDARRLLRLDIQTALCLMSIPFAACLTPAEYRRAVHSMRLDFSLLAAIAGLTGDEAFLRWAPGPPPVRVDSNADVPSMVYDHAVLCEAAHARLCRLRDQGA